MSQLAHRYPNMNLIEIGAGTGGTTKGVVRALPNFSSYTYTDVSPGFFQNAQNLFEQYTGKMNYRLLDIERDPVEQGYEPHSFDVLIASNVLHATKILATTLKNCRRLLRPGGFLVLMELTEDDIRAGFIMSALPGWWLGREDGRHWTPTISQIQWDSIFIETGFTGIDLACDGAEYDTTSVMITQAVDDRVAILREPLSDPEPYHAQDVVIVGGTTLPTVGIVRRIHTLLRPLTRSITTVKRLEDFATNEVAPSAAIICLSEFDEPAWANMTAERFEGMKNMILGSRNLLWATKARRDRQPYSNMLVGMCRSVVHESPHIKIQFLDIDAVTPQVATLFAESVLRLVALDRPDFQDILWSLERELAIENGGLLIPRVIPDETLNHLVDSEKRVIHKEITSTPTSQHADLAGGGLAAVKEGYLNNQSANIHIQCEASSLFPLSVNGGLPLFLSTGTIRESGETVAVLSSAHNALVETSPSQAVALKSNKDSAIILTEILLSMFAESLVAAAKTTLWVHEPDDLLSRLLLKAAMTHNKGLFLSTSTESNNVLRTFIHPRVTQRGLRYVIPSGVSNFINLGSETSSTISGLRQYALKNKINILPVFTVTENGDQALALSYDQHEIVRLLNHSISQIEISSNDDDLDANTSVTRVQNADQDETAAKTNPFGVVRWDDLVAASTRVQPIDPKTLFSDQKTYLLIGLTGELGLSLCQWMTDHGARHIAITSRNPNIDPNVIEDLGRRGLNLRIFPLDIADMDGLKRVVTEIRSTMPQIAGVANAAMVLRDKPFDNLSLEEFQVVLGPKVNGSRNLDELFFSDSLDFFIMFSSLACVVGSKGQSNYGTANMYMHSLAQQRRNRGVAASIIDIPVLLGVGYVARALDQYEGTMKQLRFKAISEVEFHSAFAAAIISGRPDSEHGPEIIIGLNPSAGASWSNNPRFAHHAHDDDEGLVVDGAQKQTGDASSAQDPKSQLARAQNSEETLAIIEAAFARKLQLILQVPADKIDNKVPLMKLGIDSLVAVEIRSFFLKELNVDMPVLKVLSGASLLDLCKDALTRLPEELRGTGSDDQSSEQQDTPAESIAPSPRVSPETLSGSSPSQPSSDAGSIGQDFVTVEIADTAVTTPSVEKTLNMRPLHERRGEMSFAQARLYFLHIYLEDPSTYNVTMVGKVGGPGKLDVRKFERALRQVSTRHESLRSSFFIDSDSGKAIQAVNPEPDIVFVHKNIESVDDVRAEKGALLKYRHDIEHGQTMKVVILSMPSSQHVLFSYHHIALDGVSWVILLNDLDRAYSGHGLELMGNPTQAIDFSMMQRRAYATNKMQNEIQYWKKTFASQPDTLPLFPFSRVKSRQLLREYDTETFEVRMNADWTKRIKGTSRSIQVTPFHFYLASLAAFVASVLGIRDFSLGITDANRLDSEYMQTIGYFLNLLPLRFLVESGTRFDELAQNTRDQVHEALANSRLHFDAILDHLHVDRSGNHNPLFQIALNYRMGGAARNRVGPRNEIEWTEAIAARNPYDIIVDVTETAEFTHIAFTTQKYLYSASDSRMMMTRYIRAIENLVQQPSTPVSEYLSCNNEDLEQTIALGRGERRTVDWPATLSHRIDNMADKYPDSVAVKDGSGNTLTYGQLMRRANSIASELLSRGVVAGSGAYIGVLLEPVSDVVSSLLAIMRLGLVYVPLDIRNPTGRLAAIVNDCKPAAIICNSSTHEQARQFAQTEKAVVNLATAQKDQQTKKSTKNYAEGGKPGFAIYTSGSTGQPKGVILLHAGVLNQIWAISTLYGVGREVVLQQSSFGFDLALEQILLPLANGGSVIMAPQGVRGDGIQLANLIVREGVTYTEFVPSEYLSLLRYGSEVLRKSTSWRFAFSGGEKVTPQLRRAFRKLGLPGLQFINLYGPAEASLSCTRGVVHYQEVEDVNDEGDSFSGYAMPNYSIIILDEHQQPLPTGFPGEICIGGAGTALGYLNRPEETKAKFIPNKFATPNDVTQGWTTLYRSGDRGRLLEDGSIHYLGRMDGDAQVKINGIRIELDEIANVITKSAPSIVDAVVSWRPAARMLVAFVVFAADFSGDKVDFLRHLQLNLPLPSYMCPSLILPLHQIPTNPNGKKDRAAIDKLDIPSRQNDTTTNNEDLKDMEAKLKMVWEEVIPQTFADSRGDLGIGRDSDFFRTGGNSLLLIKLQAAIRATLGCTISLPELFQSTTLSSMALRVNANLGESSDTISALPDLDWRQEVASLMEGLPTPALKTRKGRKSGLKVVLTGATGFLGRYLLRSLVSLDSVQEVHCIAIRPDADGKARHVTPHGKVIEHAGDLSEKHLGLSASTFKELSNSVDLIIHNGADVSFLKTYASLRRSNVLSTRTLMAMALPRAVPLHFVSTASVAAFSRVGDEKVLGLPERSLAEDLPSAGANYGRDTTALGYAASKWVSENLLERAVSEYGLGGWKVHRLASAVGEDAPESDLVGVLRSYSQVLRAVPRLGDNIQGSFDFVPVETVAHDIVASAQADVEASAPGLSSGATLTFTHHCNPANGRVSPQDFGKYMKKTFGGSFDESSMAVWLERARDVGLGEVVYNYLKHSAVESSVVLPALRKA